APLVEVAVSGIFRVPMVSSDWLAVSIAHPVWRTARVQKELRTREKVRLFMRLFPFLWALPEDVPKPLQVGNAPTQTYRNGTRPAGRTLVLVLSQGGSLRQSRFPLPLLTMLCPFGHSRADACLSPRRTRGARPRDFDWTASQVGHQEAPSGIRQNRSRTRHESSRKAHDPTHGRNSRRWCGGSDGCGDLGATRISRDAHREERVPGGEARELARY